MTSKALQTVNDSLRTLSPEGQSRFSESAQREDWASMKAQLHDHLQSVVQSLKASSTVPSVETMVCRDVRTILHLKAFVELLGGKTQDITAPLGSSFPVDVTSIHK